MEHCLLHAKMFAESQQADAPARRTTRRSRLHASSFSHRDGNRELGALRFGTRRNQSVREAARNQTNSREACGGGKAKHKPKKKWDPRSIFSRWMQPPDAADVSDESQSESSARGDAEVIQTPARGVGVTTTASATQRAKAQSRQNFDGGGQIAHHTDI